LWNNMEEEYGPKSTEASTKEQYSNSVYQQKIN